MVRMLSRLSFAILIACLAYIVPVGGSTESASAALLNLDQSNSHADITAQPVSVNFDSASGAFQVLGTTLTAFAVDHPVTPQYGASDFGVPVSFAINLILNNAGVATSGTLQVNGTLPPVGANSGILLQGNISQFGFQDVGPFSPVSLFEMIFTTTGGDLKDLGYFPLLAEVVLTAFDGASGYDGTFTHSFSFQSEISQTDTFSHAPEPAAAALMMVAIPSFALIRRKTRQNGRGRVR